MLIANTDLEAKQLINLYDADAARVEVVHPGVDLAVFRPHDRATPASELGLPRDAGGAAVRRPDPAAQGPRRAAARRRRAAPAGARAALPAGGAGRGWPLRQRPGAPRVARAAVHRARPRRPTWCGSCRRSPQADLARLVRRRDAGRGPVVQRVLRAGRRRGAGDRHPRGGRGRRRADHRRPRRAQRPAGRRPRARATGRPRCAGSSMDDDLRGAAGGRGRWSRPGSSPGSGPRSAPSTSTPGPARPCARRSGDRRPHRAAADPRPSRPSVTTSRRASWSTRARRRRLLVRAAGGEEAADPGPARRRRARPRRARLRVPQARREPRAGLPLAARAEPEDVRRRLRPRPAR